MRGGALPGSRRPRRRCRPSRRRLRPRTTGPSGRGPLDSPKEDGREADGRTRAAVPARRLPDPEEAGTAQDERARERKRGGPRSDHTARAVAEAGTQPERLGGRLDRRRAPDDPARDEAPSVRERRHRVVGTLPRHRGEDSRHAGRRVEDQDDRQRVDARLAAAAAGGEDSAVGKEDGGVPRPPLRERRGERGEGVGGVDLVLSDEHAGAVLPADDQDAAIREERRRVPGPRGDHRSRRAGRGFLLRIKSTPRDRSPKAARPKRRTFPFGRRVAVPSACPMAASVVHAGAIRSTISASSRHPVRSPLTTTTRLPGSIVAVWSTRAPPVSTSAQVFVPGGGTPASRPVPSRRSRRRTGPAHNAGALPRGRSVPRRGCPRPPGPRRDVVPLCAPEVARVPPSGRHDAPSRDSRPRERPARRRHRPRRAPGAGRRIEKERRRREERRQRKPSRLPGRHEDLPPREQGCRASGPHAPERPVADHVRITGSSR